MGKKKFNPHALCVELFAEKGKGKMKTLESEDVPGRGVDMMNTNKKVLEWLATDQTGTSSKTIAFTLSGFNYKYPSPPSDPSDFGRCLLLLDFIPEFRTRLSELATLSDEWKVIIENWDLIEITFLDEGGLHWDKYYSFPKTYKLMRDLRRR